MNIVQKYQLLFYAEINNYKNFNGVHCHVKNSIRKIKGTYYIKYNSHHYTKYNSHHFL
jgi:hypothetical protein